MRFDAIFTVNALFYDIGIYSIIDYTGGLKDLEERVIRCIGDPEVRFLEDPVRMLQAVVLAARLEFTIEDRVLDAIAQLKHEIAHRAAPPLLEDLLQDPALGSRRRRIPPAARHRTAERDHA